MGGGGRWIARGSQTAGLAMSRGGGAVVPPPQRDPPEVPCRRKGVPAASPSGAGAPVAGPASMYARVESTRVCRPVERSSPLLRALGVPDEEQVQQLRQIVDA